MFWAACNAVHGREGASGISELQSLGWLVHKRTRWIDGFLRLSTAFHGKALTQGLFIGCRVQQATTRLRAEFKAKPIGNFSIRYLASR